MQARRRAQPSGTNSPSSSHPRLKHRARCVIFCPCPPCGRQGRPGEGVPGRLHREAAGERPPRARPQRRGSPGPIPNPAVKPAFAESTAAQGCGRAGRRARGGRFSGAHGAASPRRKRARRAGRGPQGIAPCGPLLRHGLPAPVSGIFGGCAFPFGRHRGGDAACAPKSRGGSSSAALFESKGAAKSIRWCWQRSAAVGPAVGISRPAGPFCAMKLRGVCRTLRLFYLRLF